MIHWLAFVMIPLAILTICPCSKATKTGLHEFCPWETFKATCEPSQVIVIKHARFGRMRQGRCVQNNLGYIGCSKDVLDIMDARCSGRHTCEVELPDPMLDKLQPCINDLKSYLEVSYECVDVWRPQEDLCRSPGHVILTSGEGYIANVITDETGCGSGESPWRIEADPGQTVELRVMDFSSLGSMDYTDTRHCPVYATVKEKDTETEKVVCGGQGRDHPVYTSVGHSLDVSIPTQKGSEAKYFVMHYKVIGCANPKLPPHLKFERKGKIGLATCTQNDKYWHLRCDGTRWSGRIGNCSAGGQANSNGQMALGSISLPTGLTITIIVGVSLLIGSSILLVGLVCLKFCRNQRRDEERKRRRDVEEILYDTSSKRPLSSMTVSLANPGMGTDRRTISRMREANDYACIWEWPPESGIHYGYHSDPSQAPLYASKQECQLCSVQDPLCAQPLTATCIPEDFEEGADNADYKLCQNNCSESVDPSYFELEKGDINEVTQHNIQGSPDILPYKPQSQAVTIPEIQDL